MKTFNLQPVTKDEIQAISKATTNQHTSKTWREHRIFHVTSSTIHRVYTKMTKVQQNKLANTDNLVQLLAEHATPFTNNDMLDGQSLKPELRAPFERKLRKDDHHHVTVKQGDLIIHRRYPFTAASPDAVVSCSRCGSRPLELNVPVYCWGKTQMY